MTMTSRDCPISMPGSYELSLKQRAIGDDGKPQFLYHVGLSGEKTRRLLVLLEGARPKVFWEFFEEVGDMSWAGFLAEQPEDPVKMRVWLHPVEQYVEEYDKENGKATCFTTPPRSTRSWPTPPATLAMTGRFPTP